MNLTRGVGTSEFWLLVAQQVVGLCVLFGVVTPNDQPLVDNSLGGIIMGVGTVLANAATLCTYIKSRTAAKTESMKNS